ncbi:MAG: DNA replication/repair protein RecF [Oscillospiraceae bacterium]|nr:DNA replication/repair protein RecF [Oscillospiraceae bacterium]
MIVTEVGIKGFRNLSETVFEPCGEINIFHGENAQGKTNIAEAIWLFSGMKSFRGAKDSELINYNSQSARLSIKFQNSIRENSAQITVSNKRSAVLNGVKLPSCVSLIGKLSAVVFSPSFLSVVESGPSERRRFIDAAVCQIKPSFAAVLSEYSKLLKQRNSLLKDVSFESSLLDILDVIDEKMALAGERIARERKDYLSVCVPPAKEIFSGLSSGKEEVDFIYKSSYESFSSLKDALKNNRKTDIIAGITSSGPHRDDIDILLNGVSVKSFGSQGQKRSCAVVLKLTEAHILGEKTGEKPIIILDDVMSELDASRQDFILNHIKNRQVFITCCDPSSVYAASGGKKFEIKNGNIIKCI